MLKRIRRFVRKMRGRCITCGRSCSGVLGRRYTYCSIECACYDGAFSVTRGWRTDTVEGLEILMDMARKKKGINAAEKDRENMEILKKW